LTLSDIVFRKGFFYEGIMAIKRDLKGLSLPELEEFLGRYGKERYRARQIFRWIYQKGETRIENMTNLSRNFREEIMEDCHVSSLQPVRSLRSDDGTEKFVFSMEGDVYVEAVLIPEEKRRTVCVSTQAGCRMGCVFCATGEAGFQRNLSSSEIIGQICYVESTLNKRGNTISNVVFMGMGEPLDNVEELLPVIDILRSVFAFSLSSRKITISTCGVIPVLESLMSRVDVSIALSLNATTDEVRDRLMPVNRKYPIKDIIGFLRGVDGGKKKRITVEYVLIDGVNDSGGDARRLLRFLRGSNVKVNLIPYNLHGEPVFRAPERKRIDDFREILIGGGIRTITREKRGADIYAACGQLSGKVAVKEENALDRNDTLT
jgi:23S rRNA (adenine2503-C2)-methyltransferase